MMTKHIWSGTALAAGLALFGCENNVQEAVEDLKEARRESPEVANDLQRQLDEAKAEVARLEEKLALAQRGVTDDVRAERQELKGALKEEEQEVREEVKEAQRAARNLNQNTQQAEQLLERTQPPESVRTEVNTRTEVVPGEQEVEVNREQKNIPIDSARATERKTESRDRKAKEAPTETR